MGDSQKKDGFITLSGYNADFVGDAKNLTRSIYKPSGANGPDSGSCREGMFVEITGLDINWKDGRVDRLMRNETERACVAPNWSGALAIPDKYWARLNKTTGFRRPDDAVRPFSTCLYYMTQAVGFESG